jgi:hypothetical protein
MIARDDKRPFNTGNNSGDTNVVSNLRFSLKGQIADWSDQMVAQAWSDFSLSADYYEKDRDAAFSRWISDYDKE